DRTNEAPAAQSIGSYQAFHFTRLKENWFSKGVSKSAELITLLSLSAILLGSSLFFSNTFGAASLMPATVTGVFEHGEYWRLWTAIFAHADLGHLLSNMLLFVPFAYFLNGYFGSFLFPLLGFVTGGLANYLTLKTMGSGGSLIGASGVVFWMGASWLTLYVLVETKESFRRRLGKALAIGAALFLPQSFEPNISYACHFFGFGIGMLSAASFYYLNQAKFKAADIYETVVEEPESWEYNPSADSRAIMLRPVFSHALPRELDSRYNPSLQRCRTC
ncbi:MAG: rhomboid family intramembrane serine protease, partial [Proteobacteria bacterium]